MKKLLTFLILFLLPTLEVSANWTNAIINASSFDLPSTTPDYIITEFLLWLLSMLAIVTVLALVISGFMLIISGGNPDQTKQAKEYIKYSIMGLAVALSGYIIVRFIDNLLFGYYW